MIRYRSNDDSETECRVAYSLNPARSIVRDSGLCLHSGIQAIVSWDLDLRRDKKLRKGGSRGSRNIEGNRNSRWRYLTAQTKNSKLATVEMQNRPPIDSTSDDDPAASDHASR